MRKKNKKIVWQPIGYGYVVDEEIAENHDPGGGIFKVEEKEPTNEEEWDNSPCFCGSGIKHKDCCGKDKK